jgi:Na+/H+ antiporter NhaB
VFFAVVAVIIDQQLFTPVIEFVLQASPHAQLSLSVTPVKVVARMITDRPIRPTSAR